MKRDTKILAASVGITIVLGLAWLTAREKTVSLRPEDLRTVGNPALRDSPADLEQANAGDVSDNGNAEPEDVQETARRLRSLGLPESWVCAAVLPEINNVCMQALVEGYANMLAPWEQIENNDIRRQRASIAIKKREELIKALWGDQSQVEALLEFENEIRRYAVEGNPLTKNSGNATARVWALSELSEEGRGRAIEVVGRGDFTASGDGEEGAPYVEIEGTGTVYVRSANLQRLLHVLSRYELPDADRFEAATDMLGLLNAAPQAGPEGGVEAAGRNSLARIRELYGRDIAKDVERNGLLGGE